MGNPYTYSNTQLPTPLLQSPDIVGSCSSEGTEAGWGGYIHYIVKERKGSYATPRCTAD